ncbi:protein JINGUBANG [Primulina eburnea]|uniref:protein JINGUBANG n=1 Tax=Primulina eburnea TaxID=1245227 RepID=UPI003C6C8B2E
MKLRLWLSTCSSGSSATVPALPKNPFSDTASSSCSDILTNSSISSATSLQSNLSLLTLPSVPSLQKLCLSPEDLAPSVDARFLFSLQPSRAYINFLILHDNLLYTASGNEINVFEIIDNTLVDTFNGEKNSSGSVKSIAFSNGKVFTAHQDCKIRVWKMNMYKQHKLIAILPTLEDRLRNFLLPQNYLKVRRHKKCLWIEHHDAISGLAENENRVLSISWDKSLKIWQPHNFRCLESINKAHDDAINAVAVSNEGLIYTGSADKRIKVWGKATGEKKHGLIAALEKHKSAVNALALSLDGSVLFSGSCDRSILVWEREDSANHMAVTGALRGHRKAILSLMNVQDLLLSGSADRTVRIWRQGYDGKYCCLTVLEGHQTPVRSLSAVAVKPPQGDGGEGVVKVFSGSFDGEIKVWQVEVSNVNT